jgi:hypothetical protein
LIEELRSSPENGNNSNNGEIINKKEKCEIIQFDGISFQKEI